METMQNYPVVNEMMDNLGGSLVLKVAYEAQDYIAKGEKVANLTIGDFAFNSPRIPQQLENLIVEEYRKGNTNYPQAMGVKELRKSVAKYYAHELEVEFEEEEIIISSGVRPAIYATFLSTINPGEGVIYGIPSWNTKAYVKLARAKSFGIQTSPENNFLLTAEDIEPHLNETSLIAMCSPGNPTGAVMSKEILSPICEMLIQENNHRKSIGKKPIYVLYDQVYWKFLNDDCKHIHPALLFPEMKEYTIYSDGISKAFGATGLRIGWAAGPKEVMKAASNLIGFIGAWAPKPEQLASAKYLENFEWQKEYISSLKSMIFKKLNILYTEVQKMKSEGLPIDCLPPQGGLFLSINVPIMGGQSPDGLTFETTESINKYLLYNGKIALMPFTCFDTAEGSTWFRACVSSTNEEDLIYGVQKLRESLQKITL